MNQLEKKHPQLFKLYHEAYPLYLHHMKRLEVLTGDTSEEAAGKILLTQFCLMILEHLNAIYILLSSGSYLSPIPLMRSIIECELNWFYIAGDETRLSQFGGDGLNSIVRMLRRARDHGVIAEDVADRQLASIDETDLDGSLRAAGKEWQNTNLRMRAESLGNKFLKSYDLGFAYLSGYTHPSAFAADKYVSYDEEGKMRYHYFNDDLSDEIMFNAIDITNGMMRCLREEFGFDDEGHYDFVDSQLTRIREQRS